MEVHVTEHLAWMDQAWVLVVYIWTSLNALTLQRTKGLGMTQRRAPPRRRRHVFRRRALFAHDDKENQAAPSAGGKPPGKPPQPVTSPHRRLHRRGSPRRPRLATLPSVEAPSAPLGVTASAWVAVDANSGSVLAGHRHLERRQVASLTKITTACVVLEQAGSLPGLLDDVLTVSRTAAATVGTSARLHTGDKLSVHEALYGLLLPSGNDAAMALAEHVGGLKLGHGTTDAAAREWFVARMNSWAAEQGATSTSFSNPHGMDAQPDPSTHMSTAADVALLARAAMKLPTFRRIVGTKRREVVVQRTSHLPEAKARVGRRRSASLSAGESSDSEAEDKLFRFPARTQSARQVASAVDRFPLLPPVSIRGSSPPAGPPKPFRLTFANTNKMLSLRTGVDGVKTGVTRLAGPCLCTRLGGVRPVVVVVLKSASMEARFSDTYRIARWSRCKW